MKNTVKHVARLLTILLFFCLPATAQRKMLKKQDSKSTAVNAEEMAQLTKDLAQLTAPQMEGRKIGTKGEMLALNYIERRFQGIGLSFFQNKYRRSFKYTAGREWSPETRMFFHNEVLKVPEEAFPMPFSATGESEAYILPNSMEPGNIWVIPLFENEATANNPDFDLEKYTYQQSLAAIDRGATGVVFYDAYGGKNLPEFHTETKVASLDIPVWIVRKHAYEKHMKGLKTIRQIRMNTAFRNIYGDAANIFGMVDNNAPQTVLIFAHFDGEGIDASGRLYPGANDNASGVAAMLRLAALVRKSNLNKYNYLFAAFSGGFMDAVGIKKYMEASNFKASEIAYVINLDQVGLLNNAQQLIIGGTGTSGNWKSALQKVSNRLKPVFQNLGDLNSGHVEFYKQRIPYLYFYTGVDAYDHTPNDVVTRINFKGLYDITDYVFGLIKQMESEVRPIFQETSDAPETTTEVVASPTTTQTANSEVSSASAAYPVSMGISPDINEDNEGVTIAMVAPGKTAALAGLIKNDVIFQIGDYPIKNIQDYMDALTKFSHGSKTTVKIKRGGRIQQYQITFQ